MIADDTFRSKKHDRYIPSGSTEKPATNRNHRTRHNAHCAFCATGELGSYGILDYYLLPWLDLGPQRLNIAESNGIWLETYRFDGLEALYRLAARSRIRRAA